jgi:hypothetical protein
MLKFITLSLCLASTNTLISQNQFTIENSAENTAVFDTDNPDSFMSFLKFNSLLIGRFDTKGMDIDSYSGLSSNDQKSISVFVSWPGRTPLTYHDPYLPNYGENIIMIDENGFEGYVYEAPDTIWTDFDNLSKITFEYSDGEGDIWNRIDRVKFWKNYSGKQYQVLSLTGERFLSFDGFSYTYPLEAVLNQKLTNSLDSNSLWSVSRERALANFKLVKLGNTAKKDKKHEMHILPSKSMALGFFNSSNGPSHLDETKWNGGFCISDGLGYLANQKPFSLNFGFDIFEDTSAREVNHNLFTEVYMRYFDNRYPLFNEDLSSPNFGEHLFRINEKGEEEKVYRDPIPEYYWLDYSGAQIFASQTFYNDEEEGVAKPRLEDLFFTKDIKGKNEVISHIKYTEVLDIYFESYTSPKLQDFKWYTIFRSASESKN